MNANLAERNERMAETVRFACPHCGASDFVKCGRVLYSGGSYKQNLQCRRCGRRTVKPVEVKTQ